MTDFVDLFFSYITKNGKPPRGKCYLKQLALLSAGKPIDNGWYYKPFRDYVLINKNFFPVINGLPFIMWQEKIDRHVDQTWIKDGKAYKKPVAGSIWVSTIFLTMNHNFGEGDPILFETMIFGNSVLEDRQFRFRTWGEAKANHRMLVYNLLNRHKKKLVWWYKNEWF